MNHNPLCNTCFTEMVPADGCRGFVKQCDCDEEPVDYGSRVDREDFHSDG